MSIRGDRIDVCIRLTTDDRRAASARSRLGSQDLLPCAVFSLQRRRDRIVALVVGVWTNAHSLFSLSRTQVVSRAPRLLGRHVRCLGTTFRTGAAHIMLLRPIGIAQRFRQRIPGTLPDPGCRVWHVHLQFVPEAYHRMLFHLARPQLLTDRAAILRWQPHPKPAPVSVPAQYTIDH
jgi:hypothetical protein